MNGSRSSLRYKVSIQGTVQGVGFRPFVYNLASSLDIKGYVTNTSSGVEIEAEGDNTPLFLERIKRDSPSLSRITAFHVAELLPVNYETFEIRKSVSDRGSLTFIPPDICMCSACRKEIYDSNDRHYHYPFTNCTNCGPRYSITKRMPYDRKNTTMACFNMCHECEAEYNNPADRRFHAQPNACPQCGPELELKIQNPKFKIHDAKNPIEAAVKLLKQGAVIALKGIGGFHIACDAENNDAVNILRQRKKRGNKPFAVMCPDIEIAESYIELDEVSRSLLCSSEAPVVLMKKKQGSAVLAEAVAPNNLCYGITLPYTPLHDLLFFYPDRKTPNFQSLVMTSGNISEEPVIKDNDEALEKLKHVCDAFLLHNRDIFMRLDDSVVSVIKDNNTLSPFFIRRSRGYAPNPIELGFDVPPLLACGAELKSTFTIAKNKSAIVSQHLGDMDNYETLVFFEETLSNLQSVFNIKPELIFYDLHPDYLITRWAKEKGIHGAGIQHHEAHIASCISENCVDGEVIGIALDGTGYGTDGNIWGGEIFVGNLNFLKRAAHLKYIPMPGGDKAIKEPWRMAASVLAMNQDNAVSENNREYIIKRWGNLGAENILEMLDARVNAPLTSSCGRVFDAAASLIMGFDYASFEAEAAIALESIARHNTDLIYKYDIFTENEHSIIDFQKTFDGILCDMQNGMRKDMIASAFHNTIASGICEAAVRTSRSFNIKNVCLSGGVFQNRIFTEILIKKLQNAGLTVFTHKILPPNDGGISFGQAALGSWRIKCA